jgi:hypothetical protein
MAARCRFKIEYNTRDSVMVRCEVASVIPVTLVTDSPIPGLSFEECIETSRLLRGRRSVLLVGVR